MNIFLKSIYLFITLFATITHSCRDEELADLSKNYYKNFESVSELKNTIVEISKISNEKLKNQELSKLWDSLKTNKKIPFIINDSVMFLYKGNAVSVLWAGDFNRWNPGSNDFTGTLFENTDIWYNYKSFPTDARLDYKIVVSGVWMLDPANQLIQFSGFGPNSELRMPGYEYPVETILLNNIQRGILTENQIIISKPENLGYKVQFRVYLPYNYQTTMQLPVIYVTDGQEYADNQLGAMIIVLDNLIFTGQIRPILAVFIDPRDPDNLTNNRRYSQYSANIKFARFVAQELVPYIDSTYKTDTSALNTAILGTSLGGWNSAFTGYHFSSQFGLIAIHSPAFDQNILTLYEQSPKLPLKFYMSTGVIYDTQEKARQMKQILEAKQYPLMYKEVNQGHSWGNWRGLIDEPLILFFKP